MILSSKGFTIEDYFFEPFTLLRGEYMSIDFYKDQDFEIEKALREILSGDRTLDEVLIKEKVIPVIMDEINQVQFFLKKTPLRYLEERSMLTKEKIMLLLDEIDINPKTNIYSLGANERKLLSLEAAYSKTKNIIICTSGLDYTGLEKVRNRIQKEMNMGSVLEINYPTSKGRDYLFDGSQSSHKGVTYQKN